MGKIIITILLAGVVVMVGNRFLGSGCVLRAIQSFSPNLQSLCMHRLEELFFQFCCCVSFLVVVGTRFWCYVLTYQLCHCVSFLVVVGNSFGGTVSKKISYWVPLLSPCWSGSIGTLMQAP